MNEILELLHISRVYRSIYSSMLHGIYNTEKGNIQHNIIYGDVTIVDFQFSNPTSIYVHLSNGARRTLPPDDFSDNAFRFKINVIHEIINCFMTIDIELRKKYVGKEVLFNGLIYYIEYFGVYDNTVSLSCVEEEQFTVTSLNEIQFI